MAFAARPIPFSAEGPTLIDRLRQNCARGGCDRLGVDAPAARSRSASVDRCRASAALITGALHEIAAARETEIAAPGFAKGAAARWMKKRVVWIAEDLSLAENGAPMARVSTKPASLPSG